MARLFDCAHSSPLMRGFFGIASTDFAHAACLPRFRAVYSENRG
jgi:hypothetical protein